MVCRAAALALLVLFAPGARAQTAQDRAAIRDVITRQIEAFQHDDADAAWRLAAPGIQALFGSPDNFLAMVRRGYPPVYRPRSLEFSGLEIREGQVTQEVELVGPDGQPVLAVYTLELDGDGQWRITGCSLIRSVRLGV